MDAPATFLRASDIGLASHVSRMPPETGEHKKENRFPPSKAQRTNLAEGASLVSSDRAPRRGGPLAILPCFCNYRNMDRVTDSQVVRFADMFSALGTEARLRIMRALLSAHPEGLIVGEIQEELDIPNSTLSHHLEKLKSEGLVNVRRESTFLRYTANTEGLQELLRFLYAECCTRNKALKPKEIIQICE
jgi:ArsR family transcriptional regulator, arsenate/arsenite/antimonite-responsive transcriptional repressor